MEIAPIPGIRALPTARAQQGDLRPPEVFEMEGPAKPGDGGGQRGGRKAAGAEENEENELTPESEASPDDDAPEGEAERRVDYFA